MAINKLMLATLRALSYPDINSKKNYKAERLMINVTNKHYLRPFYRIWNHRIPAADHDIPVRIFSPKMNGTFPLILFFHGGGWVTGNIDSYDKICTRMAQLTDHIVVSVDYRLAPEYPFPAAAEDCYLVAKELFSKCRELFHVSHRCITLAGDSAGGNLAAVVSLMARDRGEFHPQKQILLYPATYNDHTDSSPFPSVIENGTDYLLTSKRIEDYMDLYVPNEADRRNPYFAPLLAEDLSNQPDTLVITAEFDPLRDEGEAYGKKLKRFGNEVHVHRIRDALHGFLSLPPSFPHVKRTYEHINRFLKNDSAQIKGK